MVDNVKHILVKMPYSFNMSIKVGFAPLELLRLHKVLRQFLRYTYISQCLQALTYCFVGI